jgi:hypothetical protein
MVFLAVASVMCSAQTPDRQNPADLMKQIEAMSKNEATDDKAKPVAGVPNRQETQNENAGTRRVCVQSITIEGQPELTGPDARQRIGDALGELFTGTGVSLAVLKTTLPVAQRAESEKAGCEFFLVLALERSNTGGFLRKLPGVQSLPLPGSARQSTIESNAGRAGQILGGFFKNTMNARYTIENRASGEKVSGKVTAPNKDADPLGKVLTGVAEAVLTAVLPKGMPQ